MAFASGTIQSNAPIASGILSSEQYARRETKLESIEELKQRGLSEEEIKIYGDSQKGTLHLESVHKNHELTTLLERIADIDRRINGAANSTLEIDPSICVNPIDRLHEIERDVFGHLAVDNYPSVSKRRKLTRRMERKSNRRASLPEPARQNKSEILDDNSKWDKKVWSGDVERHNKNRTNRQQIGCSQNAKYTIRNEKIVKLQTNMENHVESEDADGTKLNLADIKAIPKFKDYAPGTRAKVLFLKNLSTRVQEKDLEMLFHDKGGTSVRLMSGKMRGQAFVTFDRMEDARTALEEVNGTVVKGKPIIIVYSKQNE